MKKMSFVFSVLVFVTLLSGCSKEATNEQFGKIRLGNSSEEVTELIGKPDESAETKDEVSGLLQSYQLKQIELTEMSYTEKGQDYKKRLTDDLTKIDTAIDYNDENKNVKVWVYSVEEEDSIKEKSVILFDNEVIAIYPTEIN